MKKLTPFAALLAAFALVAAPASAAPLSGSLASSPAVQADCDDDCDGGEQEVTLDNAGEDSPTVAEESQDDNAQRPAFFDESEDEGAADTLRCDEEDEGEEGELSCEEEDHDPHACPDDCDGDDSESDESEE